MNRFILFVVFGLLFASCGEDHSDIPETIPTDDELDKKAPFEDRLNQILFNKIGIEKDEKYVMQTYKENLTDDGIEDVIITVNRYTHAVNKATEDGRLAKAAQLDFFGLHNYIIFYNSETNEFSNPLEVASSPTQELKVSFEHVSSPIYKDLIVDYNIRNSQFRIFFQIFDGKPLIVFKSLVFDNWGTDKLTANCFRLGPGRISQVKDILVYEATMKNIGPNDDYNKLKPEIECTDKLIYRFFYNPKERAYFSPDLK